MATRVLNSNNRPRNFREIVLAALLRERERLMRLVAHFMQWKLSAAFTLASEHRRPDAVACIGASYHERHGAFPLTARNPIRFGLIEWRTRAQIGGEVPSMLAKKRTLLARVTAEVREWFGGGRQIPAVKIPNG